MIGSIQWWHSSNTTDNKLKELKIKIAGESKLFVNQNIIESLFSVSKFIDKFSFSLSSADFSK